MENSSLDFTPPHRLARLLDLAVDSATWTPRDAAAALRHQLDTPLLPDLAAAGLSAELHPAGRHAIGTRTFLDALTVASTPEDWLMGIKIWAKQMRERESHPLSGGPATVLYFAAIAAMVRRRATLGTSPAAFTALSADQLREGFDWSLQQDGAEELRTLFEEGLCRLTPQADDDGHR